MRSMAGQSSSLMRVKPSPPRCWLTWNTLCSARSINSLASAGDSCASTTNSCATWIRRRRSAFTDDLGVVLDVGSGWNGIQQDADVFLSASRLQCTLPLQLFGERNRVDHSAVLVECEGRLEDPAVSFAVKHRLVDEFDGANEGIPVLQHG